MIQALCFAFHGRVDIAICSVVLGTRSPHSIWDAHLLFPVARNVTGDDTFLYPTDLLVSPLPLLQEVTYNLL